MNFQSNRFQGTVSSYMWCWILPTTKPKRTYRISNWQHGCEIQRHAKPPSEDVIGNRVLALAESKAINNTLAIRTKNLEAHWHRQKQPLLLSLSNFHVLESALQFQFVLLIPQNTVFPSAPTCPTGDKQPTGTVTFHCDKTFQQWSDRLLRSDHWNRPHGS